MLGWRCQRIRLLDADTKAGVTTIYYDYTKNRGRMPTAGIASRGEHSNGQHRYRLDIVDEPKPSDKTPSRRLPEARGLDL